MNPTPRFGLLVVGDEILSAKRADKHLSRVIELLAVRGLGLAWARFAPDDRAALATTLREALAGHDVVFSCGGIGATPDDHTRQAAASALGVGLQLHPQARALIEARLRHLAAQKGQVYKPDRPDNLQRLQMGAFPLGARIIPNPYNQIPGFSCTSPSGAVLHAVPGFPVMAWPMIEWLLEQHYAPYFQRGARGERSVIVFDGIEGQLTPLMQQIEAMHPQCKVFSLPSVDHPEYGRHLELGVKGPSEHLSAAYADLLDGLRAAAARLGPELVR
ncbi:MAG: damage-inducible protein [Comamonadaceae bacterium BICA1-1]|nr:MAG: damage-inducible protein [Comamonadaceae bacterium BICA1-1]